MLARKEQLPTAVLCLDVVLLSKALLPTAVLQPPVVLLPKALLPTAVLQTPVVLPPKALLPTAVLLAPVVLLIKALVPNIVLVLILPPPLPVCTPLKQESVDEIIFPVTVKVEPLNVALASPLIVEVPVAVKI